VKNLHTLEELQEEATSFIKNLSPKETGATLVTLSGELGAGKTAFTQAVAKALGIKDIVTSPTFVLLKEYEVTGTLQKSFSKLIHVDAYRLEGKSCEPLELRTYLSHRENLVCIEWPAMLGETLPMADVKITLKVKEGTVREISYDYA